MSFEAYRRSLSPALRAVYRMEIRGAEHLPAAGPVVIAANHESMLDPFLLAAAVPRPLRYLAKEALWRNAVLSALLDDVGAIRVVRGRSDRRALETSIAALESGEVVGIFPAGGVRRDCAWLHGAARMALTTGSPILPVRLLGTAAALSRGRVGLPRVAVVIGEPIVVRRASPTVATAGALTSRLQATVVALAS